MPQGRISANVFKKQKKKKKKFKVANKCKKKVIKLEYIFQLRNFIFDFQLLCQEMGAAEGDLEEIISSFLVHYFIQR